MGNFYNASQKINDKLIPNNDSHKYHDFAKDGWNYYYSRFKFNNNEFIGKINEGISDGKPSFYNITDIYTPQEYKKMTENGTLDKNESALIQSFLGKSISQNNQKVNKYDGRFADGTDEQLQQAKRNLEFNIKSLTDTVASQEELNKISKGIVDEQLALNKDSLKEVKLQYEELKNEFKKRGVDDTSFSLSEEDNSLTKQLEKNLEKTLFNAEKERQGMIEVL